MGARVQFLGVAAAVITCASLTLSAQWPALGTRGAPDPTAPAPKLADGKTPDFSGVWEAARQSCNEATARLGCTDAVQGIPLGAVNIATGNKEVLPMQPWAEALVKQRRDDAGKDDPASRCLPVPPPRMWWSFFFQKIVHTPDSVTVLDEYMTQYRQILLDGRALPANPEPLFKGYSVGRWEGETLVVETVGFKDDGWLDVWGHPLTAQARTIERIRRVSYGTLEVALTVDDPKAYTKPWTVTIPLSLKPTGELLEYICNENNLDIPHLVGK